MLGNIIQLCPDDLWQGDKRIFYMVYHTVIFLDYYLTQPVSDFHPQLPYTLGDMDNLPAGAVDDVIPGHFYSKDEFAAALSGIREKGKVLIMGASDEELGRRWIREDEIDLHGLCSSLVVNYSVLEILFYNLRHVQHHVGQLNLVLRQEADVAAEWIAHAG